MLVVVAVYSYLADSLGRSLFDQAEEHTTSLLQYLVVYSCLSYSEHYSDANYESAPR